MPTKTRRVTVTRNGKAYSATYTVNRGMITVRTANAKKSTQVGSSPPEVLAKLMLGEMITAGDA